jgi:hypothetical protein
MKFRTVNSNGKNKQYLFEPAKILEEMMQP